MLSFIGHKETFEWSYKSRNGAVRILNILGISDSDRFPTAINQNPRLPCTGRLDVVCLHALTIHKRWDTAAAKRKKNKIKLLLLGYKHGSEDLYVFHM